MWFQIIHLVIAEVGTHIQKCGFGVGLATHPGNNSNAGDCIPGPPSFSKMVGFCISFVIFVQGEQPQCRNWIEKMSGSHLPGFLGCWMSVFGSNLGIWRLNRVKEDCA